MEPQIHRIDRQVFNLRFSSEKSAMNARNQIRSLVDEKYEELLDDVISRFDTNGETIYIDRIDLDLGTVTEDDLSGVLKEKITRLLEEKLREIIGGKEIDKNGLKVMTKEMSYLEDLIHFLGSGRLSWWSPVKTLAELESFLTADHRLTSGSAPGLLQAVRKSSDARKRLALQFSPGFQLILIKALFPDYFPSVEMLIEKLPEMVTGTISSPSERVQRGLLSASWNQLFLFRKINFINEFPGHVIAEWCNRMNIKPEKILPVIHPYLSPESKVVLEKQKAPDSEEEQFPDKYPAEKEQSYTIANAGLVILCPYLETLFTNLGFVENGKFISKDLQERALGITQYLVTDEEGMEEHQLLFNKIITGWPIGMPVINRFYFTEQEKEECAQLLKAVISHWPVLKNTSVAGLRETFLARSGRLQIKENEYILRVERSGIDVLLDQLPWSITVIRLPWMKPILFVEW